MSTSSGHARAHFDHHSIIDSAFEETTSLLAEARAYAARVDSTIDDAKVAPLDRAQMRLHERAEAFRVTARLANVMVWLLMQRATRSNGAGGGAPTSHRLGDRGLCADPGGRDDPEISETLRELLNRSHALYCRVMRLDDEQAAQRAPRRA